MTAVPQSNAVLTSITGTGFSEDYDRPASESAPKWSGSSDIFVDDRIKSVFNPTGGLDRVRIVTIYLDSELRTSAELVAGDNLHFTMDGVSYTSRVQDLTAAEMPGAPSYTVAIMEQINAT